MYFPHAFRKSFLPSTVAATSTTTVTLGTTTGTVIALTSATGALAGQSVSGAGIQPGTTIVSISGSNITISLPITAALVAATTALTIGGTVLSTTPSASLNAPNVLQLTSVTGISVGMSVTGTSIPANTTVTAISGSFVTLSNSVTATISTGATISFGLSVPLLATGTTASLTAGQVGFFNPDGTAVQAVSARPFMIAQGSYFLQDKISPALGGYKESVKTKMINPKYISRVIKITAKQARQQVVQVPVTCGLTCDTTYRLRVDVKGSPALRFLSHNMYRTLDSYTGCCSTVDPTLQKDPVVTLINWADQINTSPIFNTMVQARVYSKVGTTVTGTWAVVGTGLSAQTLSFGSGNTTGVSVGQKITGTNIPANSFITAVATTATATAGAGGTSAVSSYTVASGNTLSGAVTVGSSVSGAGLPVGSYISVYSSTTSYTIAFPTQAAAPTISGVFTVSASATVTYPTAQTAPTSLATSNMKVYNDLYSGAPATAGFNASAAGGALATPTYIPGTGSETPTSGVYGSSTVVSLGTLTGANINTTASVVLSATSGAQLYNMNPADAASFTVDAHIELTGAYIETKFGIATFTPTDKYDLEPLLMYTSIVDETGDPCSSFCFTTTNSNTGTNTSANDNTIVQAPIQASGSGETVLRDMILSDRYLQLAYPDSARVESLRMREIEQNPGLNNISRVALYDQIMVLHSVPRFNNPSGMFDNDQYLLVFHVPTGAGTSSLTNYLVGAVTATGGTIPVNSAGVTFEQY